MRRRCQPNSVSGVTSHPARLGRGSAAAIAPSKLRSASVISGRSTCRRSTPSWWRKTMISRSFERPDRTVSRASDARNRYKIRYTTNQHRPASRQVNDHGRVSGTHSLDVLFCHDAPAGVRGLRSGLDYRPPAQIEAAAGDVRALLRDVVDRTGPRLVFHGHWHHPNRDHLAGTGAEVIGSTLTAGPAVPPSWTSRRSPPPSSTATSAATHTGDANTRRRRGRALPDRHAHSPVERPEGLRRGVLRPEASTGTTGRPCSPRAPCGEQTRPPAALTALDRPRNRDFPPDRRTSSLYNGPKSDLSQRRG